MFSNATSAKNLLEFVRNRLTHDRNTPLTTIPRSRTRLLGNKWQYWRHWLSSLHPDSYNPPMCCSIRTSGTRTIRTKVWCCCTICTNRTHRKPRNQRTFRTRPDSEHSDCYASATKPDWTDEPVGRQFCRENENACSDRNWCALTRAQQQWPTPRTAFSDRTKCETL